MWRSSCKRLLNGVAQIEIFLSLEFWVPAIWERICYSLSFLWESYFNKASTSSCFEDYESSIIVGLMYFCYWDRFKLSPFFKGLDPFKRGVWLGDRFYESLNEEDEIDDFVDSKD